MTVTYGVENNVTVFIVNNSELYSSKGKFKFHSLNVTKKKWHCNSIRSREQKPKIYILRGMLLEGTSKTVT
jgi:hypothetical protein